MGLLFCGARASFKILPSGETYQVLPTQLDPGQFASSFTPRLFSTATLLLGPLLVRALWQLEKQGSKPGRWSYRLAVGGLALATNLVSFWWLTTGHPVPPPEFTYSEIRLAFAGVVYLGLLILLAGALFFSVPALLDRPARSQVAFLLLLLWFRFRLRQSCRWPLVFVSRSPDCRSRFTP